MLLQHTQLHDTFASRICSASMRCIVRLLLVPLLLVSVGKATLSGTLQQQQRLQTTSQDKSLFDSAFDAFVQATLREWHVPGLSIAVVDNGKVSSKVSLTPPIYMSPFVLVRCLQKTS